VYYEFLEWFVAIATAESCDANPIYYMHVIGANALFTFSKLQEAIEEIALFLSLRSQ